MAFPLIPVLLALALYVLHDDEPQTGEDVKDNKPPGQNAKHKKRSKVKENNSVGITQSDIDDSANSVPDSAPQPPENSVPTDIPPENPPESQNVQ